MVKHTLTAVSIGVLVFILYLMQYTGAFKSVTVGVDQRGPYTMIYKEHIGAYHKIVSTIEEVEKWAQANGLKCRLSFGEYFDDPKMIEEGRLKSRGGCLLDPQDKNEEKLFSSLKSKLPTDFKSETYSETKAVVALFTGAAGIGPLKVYPKAEDFIQNGHLIKKGPVLEIYEIFDKTAMQTLYIWPIE
jgi:hypothetical protein